MGFRSWDVDQVSMFPPSVKDFVPEGHVAHIIRDAGRETLDLEAIVEKYQQGEGRPVNGRPRRTARRRRGR